MNFDCVFMKPGGSNFTCSCFTLHHKFWIITRGWENFQYNCVYCAFMKLGGSNFTCSCFTLYHKFWLIPRGDILPVAFPLHIMNFDCVFMKPGGSNFTCSCFTLYHKFRLIQQGDILIVAFPLRIMNFDCRVGRSPFFFRKLVSRSTACGRSADFEFIEILG